MRHPVFTIARYTLLEGLRARLPWLALLMLLALFAASALLGQLAITESLRIQTTFLAATLRPAAVFMLCLHIIGSMTRDFNDKGFEFILSLDIPRASYVLGKLLGFGLIGILLAVAVSAVVMAPAPTADGLLWTVSLVCELWLVAALSLFCVIALPQIMPAASFVLGFYVLARSIAAMQLMSGSPILGETSLAHQALPRLVDLLALLLPRLDTFTQSAWLVDHSGGWNLVAAIAAQAAIYVGLLAAATMFDLYRKNF
jgi:ABC-type transport system involved in multi-copper enzyme maturation permease subunit